MQSYPRQITQLLAAGVNIPNPQTVTIAEDVPLENISSDHVTLHPGTRILGADTVISAGCQLSTETPMTIDNCQLGPNVTLAGGYATQAVFLEASSLGSGAHVRAGTILEEQASGAHTVGLKQTILFPFATLGSLINFCDCLLAGGTSRKNHSEVGSSYIHFNFTPDGDKTTASLFGDVPKGVLLNQEPIFLGGQGGVVGPVTTGFGTVVGAGSILRVDIPDQQLVIPEVIGGITRPRKPGRYTHLTQTVGKNLTYIASLVALEAWYEQIRQLFFQTQPLGEKVYAGARKQLAAGIKERQSRLGKLFAKLDVSTPQRAWLKAYGTQLWENFSHQIQPAPAEIIQYFGQAVVAQKTYIEAVQALPEDKQIKVQEWLQEIITKCCQDAAAHNPQIGLFR